MRFRVIWKPEPQQRLTEIWMASGDRTAVTEAVNRIDAILATDPDSAGESRDESMRVLFLRPLVVLFEVIEEDRRVDVVGVHDITRRR
ncbi:MAG: hypothetical protein ACE5KM_22565 [Planctomycetaceae bacterium]